MGNEKERNTGKKIRSVMSMYDGAKIRVRVDSELSDEFGVKVGMYQGSMLSPFLFAVAAVVVIGQTGCSK